MRRRFIGLFIAVPALLAGVFSAVPAEAASFYASVRSTNVAVDKTGVGQVLVACYAKTTCRGRIFFTADNPRRYTSYTIGPKSSKYVRVAMASNSTQNPHTNGTAAGTGTDVKIKRGVGLTVQESSPRGSRTVHYYSLTAETRVTGRFIEGRILPSPGSSPVTKMQVRLVTPVRGGNVRLVDTANVAPNGSYKFYAPFGAANTSLYEYRLEIVGEVDSETRSWWWRGSDENPVGGGRYVRDASVVKPSKFHNFQADFLYGSIRGNISGGRNVGADVTVAAPPPVYSTKSADLRELDIERCADVYGRARTSSTGGYKVDFLPVTTTGANRYMIGVQQRTSAGAFETWRGQSPTDLYGSCYDAINYSYSASARESLLRLVPNDDVTANLPVTAPGYEVLIPVRKTGYTPTAADQWIRIREKVPGLKVLDMPIVKQGQGRINSNTQFLLSPGNYIVETGRFTGTTGKSPISPCTGWYPSVFPDNGAYFKGAERAAERWKTVSGSREETSTSVRNGYVRKSPGSGKKGWMFRNYCKSLSSGTINSFGVHSTSAKRFIVNTTTSRRGGTVYGKVQRTGGRTPKEMMVRVANSAGTVVARYDVADSGGKFYVAGLPRGTYSISVNPDSWRGIARSFKGKHTIRVTGSGYYNAGTVKLRG